MFWIDLRYWLTSKSCFICYLCSWVIWFALLWVGLYDLSLSWNLKVPPLALVAEVGVYLCTRSLLSFNEWSISLIADKVSNVFYWFIYHFFDLRERRVEFEVWLWFAMSLSSSILFRYSRPETIDELLLAKVRSRLVSAFSPSSSAYRISIWPLLLSCCCVSKHWLLIGTFLKS